MASKSISIVLNYAYLGRFTLSHALYIHCRRIRIDDALAERRARGKGRPRPGTRHEQTRRKAGRGKTGCAVGRCQCSYAHHFPALETEEYRSGGDCLSGRRYSILAFDLEGTEVCQWLNSVGVTAVLVKYRVPARKGLERYTAPLQDAQRALGVVRSHAADWHIDPKRVGIMGFSAGGHLSAAASTRFEKRDYEPVDEADQLSCRPDFAMLIYPAYLVHGEGPELAPELTVTSNTPPTFIVQTEDDHIKVENSIYYYLALKKAKVPTEMHLFPKGGHGYGLRESENAVTTWPKLAGEWMRKLGVLKQKSKD
jgi:hypothetical protein